MVSTRTAPASTQPADVVGRVLRWALALLAFYLLAWVMGRVVLWLAVDVLGRTLEPLGRRDLHIFIPAFFLFFMPLLYAGCSALAGRWLRPAVDTLVLYVGTTFFVAVWAEIAADTAFVLLLGRPGWLYHVWPVHHGYTSGVGLIMWPMYGFFVCLLHEAIRVNPRLHFLDGDVQRAVLVALDAMVLEVAANAFSLLAFGTWFFHYHAPDLHHFTTWEIFVPYVVAGAVGLQVLHLLERRAPRVATGVVMFVLGVLSVLAQTPA